MQNTYKKSSSETKPLIVRKLFNATAFGSETEKAKPLLNLPDVLIINNIYHLQVSKFVHSWHKGLLPEEFDNIFQYASHKIYMTAKQNLYKPSVQTDVGKQSISFMATNVWKDLPTPLKKLKCVFISEVNYTLSTVRTTNEVIFLYADHATCYM